MIKCTIFSSIALAVMLLSAGQTYGQWQTIAETDFENDNAATVGISGRGIGWFGTGDATGAGPDLGVGGGIIVTFLPNQYDVGRQGTLGNPAGLGANNENWYENGVARPGNEAIGIPPLPPLDIDPDTNWQPYVVNILADNEAWGNNTNVAFFQDNHQGNAAPAPAEGEDRGRTDRDNFGRDIFLKFARPVQVGQSIRASFDYNQVSSAPGWIFTSDINQMLADTAAADNATDGTGDSFGNAVAGDLGYTDDVPVMHPPLTNWQVVDGTELMMGVDRGEPRDYHALAVFSASGFGASGPFHVWGDKSDNGYRDRIEAVSTEFGPENEIIPGGCGVCFKGPFTYTVEFVVGAEQVTSMTLTSSNGTAFDASDDLTVNLLSSANSTDHDPACTRCGDPYGGQLPITNPDAGAIEGLVFTDSYRKQAQAWYDNIKVEATPEPASLSLLGLGALMMFRRRRA